MCSLAHFSSKNQTSELLCACLLLAEELRYFASPTGSCSAACGKAGAAKRLTAGAGLQEGIMNVTHGPSAVCHASGTT
jgi:hypothetical protein